MILTIELCSRFTIFISFCFFFYAYVFIYMYSDAGLPEHHMGFKKIIIIIGKRIQLSYFGNHTSKFNKMKKVIIENFNL